MERDDPGIPGVSAQMSPFDELELMDLHVEHAAIDEDKRCFCPDTHPKPPHQVEEGVTDREGRRSVDVMLDTPAVDPLASFDLTADDLRDLDPL